MGQKRALEILTNPSPNARAELVLFIANRAEIRCPKRVSPKIEDIWYIVAICLRWGGITKQEMPNLSRTALGNLVADTYDVWVIQRSGIGQ